MSKIKNIDCREILDSRGNPTLAIDITLRNGSHGVASVPSGASVGKYEAIEKRDGDTDRYLGKGMQKAIQSIKQIIKPNLLGLNSLNQRLIDKLMINIDGTENKSNLGANAILGVSMANAHAAANFLNIPLYRYLGGINSHVIPVPLINIINGGVHADSGVDIQEFMIVPIGAGNFSDAIRWGAEVYHRLKYVLTSKKMSVSLGDEGGYSPKLQSNRNALDLILEAIEKSSFTPGKDIFIAIDVASSEFYRKDMYLFEGKKRTSEFMCDYYLNLIKNYPLISIEDPLSEGDWDGWCRLTKTIGHKTQLVGDDLFATNLSRIKKGVKLKAANSVLIKLNQIGSLTETLDAIAIAQKSKYNTIISHRSGETEDTTIADLSVALNSGQIKTGAPARSERVAKYNRLLCIEESLGKQCIYNGREIFKKFI